MLDMINLIIEILEHLMDNLIVLWMSIHIQKNVYHLTELEMVTKIA